ncbi:Protein of unknown function [Pyronema omphalodes CBS 100304]|uniref:Uncharacterized protein n=1 Tax=Pyronema omphalodes (strain CBS 100304) TaxID=1076935 RepID=U4LI35_PYROM|nr:Protein of unknown function [Pyronema omphalodes CBS 100304]
MTVLYPIELRFWSEAMTVKILLRRSPTKRRIHSELGNVGSISVRSTADQVTSRGAQPSSESLVFIQHHSFLPSIFQTHPPFIIIPNN